ncbi:MAG: N-acetyltransferase [Bacteroidetes bacterium]|uniref:GNAT family N-acetyltransferase n=1 Tax=Phaeocystidibacter marisrubri TaxID=1577780 RepID=A0A6L3ZH22_9FLAO|nr:GNAT family N-acetyltransferase [Phaeocystidibacter marisrubri]KAB2816624.1 GNAT family N-acetyltransferase [Phaeocystidibacter marisrubri]TNE30913.1 MAG: N-acetyltransferase [Bacteroidota bacterium]GGH70004.1 N-acetyltransferase [Phaeocystidibacter marisrubri]
MIFETDRLIVRELSMSDLPSFTKLEGNPDIVRYTNSNAATPAEAKDDLLNIIENYTKQRPDKLIWAAVNKETEAFIGTVALVPFDDTTLEIGYRILVEHWGRGYATELCPALIEYGLTFENISRIYAEADVRNSASIHILDRFMTFTKEIQNERLNCIDRHYEVVRREASVA